MYRIHLLILTFLCFTQGPAPAAQPESVSWRENLQEATKEVAEQGRPMLLLFTMDGCGYCQLMKRTTYADRQVAASINSHFIPTRVNGQEHRRLAQRLGIRVYPTTVIISPENRVIDRFDGYVKAQALLPRLTTAAEPAKQARTDSKPVR